jgi:hypothetical protein
MSEKAARYSDGKPQLSYILHFPTSVTCLGRIMEYGAKKYAPMNWKKGGKPDQEYLDSCLRHLYIWMRGQQYDEESGCNHIGHAIWNLMALLDLNYPNEAIDIEEFGKEKK